MKISKPYLLPIERNKFKKMLRGALLSYSPEDYSIYAYLSTFMAFIAGIFLTSMPNLRPFFPFLPLVFSITTFFLFLTYPYIKMKSRKTKIDLKLPHAISYMLSFCEFLPIYQIIRIVYEEKEIYGEVSEEFAFVVRDVELLGEDVISALTDLRNSTPSENLREFLDGLIIALESGGNLKGYMLTKINHFRERARKQSELNLKTLEILSEVYVVLFVALPIFLIILIFSMGITGSSVGIEYYLYLYLFLPVGSILLIFIIDTVNVKEDLSLVKAISRGTHFSKSIVSEKIKSDFVFSKKNGLTDLLKSTLNSVKKNYYNSLYFSFLAFGAFAIFTIKKPIPLSYFESYLVIGIVSFLIPLSLAFEYRGRTVRKVEKEIPNLLREILNLKDVGVSLHQVVRIIKESKIGVLSKELKLANAEMEWGETVIEALIEIVNRIGTASIRRVISLLVNASQATENLREMLLLTIEDFEFELKLKTERFVNGLSYLFIIYLSFYIFLYTVYTLNHSFLSAFEKFGMISLSQTDLMYRVSVILALFSGIIAGQMEKGHVLYGLKHSCVFAFSSLILFEILLGGLYG